MEVGGNSFHEFRRNRVCWIVPRKTESIERSSPWKRSFRRKGGEGIAKEGTEKKWKRGRTRIGISIGGSR